MKEVLFFVIVCVLLSLASCEKQDETTFRRDATAHIETDVSKSMRASALGSIKWHRPIELNRNGKPCNCILCFGLCPVETYYDITYEYSKIDLPLSPPKSGDAVVTYFEETIDCRLNIYLLEDVSWVESEIVIDEDVYLRVSETGSEMKILAGEYLFTTASGFIDVGGSHVQHFGYFTGKFEEI